MSFTEKGALHASKPVTVLDTIIVDENARGTGYAFEIMKFVARTVANKYGAEAELEWVSGTQRTRAHAFYERKLPANPLFGKSYRVYATELLEQKKTDADSEE